MAVSEFAANAEATAKQLRAAHGALGPASQKVTHNSETAREMVLQIVGSTDALETVRAHLNAALRTASELEGKFGAGMVSGITNMREALKRHTDDITKGASQFLQGLDNMAEASRTIGTKLGEAAEAAEQVAKERGNAARAILS